MNSLISLPALGERRTASDEVADTLREAIIAGQFDDGQELNQVELARHFGVSRVPVREALRKLEAEGLVAADAYRRVVVPGLTPHGISEIFEVRAVLEAYLLERAAPNLDAAALNALMEMAQATKKARGRDGWLVANQDFHDAMFAPADAPHAMAIVQRLTRQVERYTHRHHTGVSRQAEGAAEHVAIVEALQRGAAKQAAKLLSKHILTTRDAVLKSLNEGSKQ